MKDKEVPNAEEQSKACEQIQTLAELVATKAREWKLDKEVVQVVAGYREQRERWNREQMKGSRTRVPAKSIPTAGPELVLGARTTKKTTPKKNDTSSSPATPLLTDLQL